VLNLLDITSKVTIVATLVIANLKKANFIICKVRGFSVSVLTRLRAGRSGFDSRQEM
jgi:ribosomal protein L10